MFLTASNVVRAVYGITQLLLFSTFLINDLMPLFTLDMIYIRNKVAILKLECRRSFLSLFSFQVHLCDVLSMGGK